MMRKNTMIVQRGDPILRRRADPVPLSTIGTKKLEDIIAQMTVALEREPDGVAIAAPQIGVPLRIFVISKRAFEMTNSATNGDVGHEGHAKTPRSNKVFINPEIIKCSRKKVQVPEGCLSVRWMYGNTMRHEKATVRAYDEHGRVFTLGGAGLIAQIFQHEIDHLNGILFTDHATNLEEIVPEHTRTQTQGTNDL